MAASMAAMPGERDSSCSVAVEADRDDDDDVVVDVDDVGDDTMTCLCLLLLLLLLLTLVFMIGGRKRVVPRGDANALVRVTSEATVYAIIIIIIVSLVSWFIIMLRADG